MKMKKILACAAAAALAVSAMATNAFAAENLLGKEVNFAKGWGGEVVEASKFADIAEGDMVTVEYTINNEDEYHLITVSSGAEGWGKLDCSTKAVNNQTDEGFKNQDDGFAAVTVDGSVSYTLTANDAAVAKESGLTVRGYDITVKSLYIGAPEAAADTDAASATDGDSSFTANLETALYVGENVTWNIAKSDSVTVTGAGDYTYSISGLEVPSSALTVIYIKDVAVESGSASTSDIAPIKITYKSLKINGEEVAVKEGAPDALSDAGVFDCALYNIWAENYIDVTAETINSVELTVNIAAASEEDADATESATEAPATEAPATEAPATEAPATEAPATEAPATEEPATEAPATEAPAADTTAAPTGDANNTSASDKGNADTGVEGVAVVAALAVLAGGAVVIAKKRK